MDFHHTRSNAPALATLMNRPFDFHPLLCTVHAFKHGRCTLFTGKRRFGLRRFCSRTGRLTPHTARLHSTVYLTVGSGFRI